MTVSRHKPLKLWSALQMLAFGLQSIKLVWFCYVSHKSQRVSHNGDMRELLETLLFVTSLTVLYMSCLPVVLWIFPMWHSQNTDRMSWYVCVFLLKWNQTFPKQQQHRLHKHEGRNTYTPSIFAHPSLSSWFCITPAVITVLFFFLFCLMPIRFRGKLIWELNLIYLALYRWNTSGDQRHEQHHADNWGAWAGLNCVIGWGWQMTVRKYVRFFSRWFKGSVEEDERQW